MPVNPLLPINPAPQSYLYLIRDVRGGYRVQIWQAQEYLSTERFEDEDRALAFCRNYGGEIVRLA